MRIVIDLQGAQGGSSRFRGIGRYGLSLTQWLARNKGEHEVFVALNGEFSGSNEALRAALNGLVPPENIIVWEGPAPNYATDPANDARRKAAELIRESALANLKPDYVIITSVFEGLSENIVTSVDQLISTVPTAVILYDLIPLIHRGIYLSNPVVAKWYENKLTHFRNADLLLAISESSRQEAIAYLGADPKNAVNISTAAEDHFTPAVVDAATRAHLATTYGLNRPFVMYTGGIDFRKNIEGLIEAFSALPKAIRNGHQLAIVCAVQDAERQRLLKLAADMGVVEGGVVLTGFIPEDDLVACYRLCKLFVFPSWHEGFGLPVLEAMKCGRAVIASDRSSLPEVVGLDSALFDPFDLEALSGKIGKLLSDDRLRADLERHSLKQAEKFNWDSTSRRAWVALEEAHAKNQSKASLPVPAPSKRPRMAFLSPLPPEASGIADYSAELLPELARHYQIDVVVAQDAISDPAIPANFPIRDVAWFRQHAHQFQRIIYHFGNSHFHVHMFDLIRDFPGVVVLHDFFLSGIAHYRAATGGNPSAFSRELLDTHGWPAVVKQFTGKDVGEVIWAYPCSLEVIQDSLGVIVHADYSRKLARQWYGGDAADDWHTIPLLRQPLMGLDRKKARKALGIAEGDFVVCSFGLLGPMKMNDRLLCAWLASPLANDPRCHLVFVGKNDPGEYGIALEQAIRSANTVSKVEITGWTDMATFRRWLAVADVGVQLRTLSRGETSAAVLDCMNAGMATITNANGSMAELPKDCVWLMDDEFTDAELVTALNTLWKGDARRGEMGQRAKAHIGYHHQPRRCAEEYARAIEQCYVDSATAEPGVTRALIENGDDLTTSDWANIGKYVSRNLPLRPRLKRLLVDISELVQRDSRSGIQRVVRSILKHWLENPPLGYIVEPVYAQMDQGGYRYARQFTSRFLNIWDGWCDDEWVEPSSGDLFIGLDLQPGVVPQQFPLLQEWRRRGIKINFVLYDLLPVTRPEFFFEASQQTLRSWLNTISQFDGIFSISRAVADEYYDWLDHYGPKRELPLEINWFHLGGDTESSVPTTGLPESVDTTLEALRAAPSFLIVGTIEPRKGLRQVLSAFEAMWAEGTKVNLVLVGKLGWMMDDFADSLRDHPRLGTSLFWLEAISDEYLDLVYASSQYLLAASEGEGFGLPLFEAAKHGLPVLAREIPVFREIAGAGARYFADNSNPDTIAVAVKDLISPGKGAMKTQSIRWLSWAESADALLNQIVSPGAPYKSWLPDDTLRLWGSDSRMLTMVGTSDKKHIRTSGKAGFLTYGPYLPLTGQSYRMVATGDVKSLVGTEFMDVSSQGGTKVHWRGAITSDGETWRVNDVIKFEKPVKDLEIRVWVDQGSIMSIASIVLEPVNRKDKVLEKHKVTALL